MAFTVSRYVPACVVISDQVCVCVYECVLVPAGASVSWVNNLDLLVTGPDGARYFPNGRSSPDRVNNVEKVGGIRILCMTHNIMACHMFCVHLP